jgi:trehalose utilization protein
MSIRVVVWNENIHEQDMPEVREIYPKGIHGAIADALVSDPGFQVTTATQDQPEHGLPESVLDNTDVLFWWSHAGHDKVSDAVVDRVQKRVLEGMGLICLHSSHYAKIFKRLLGTSCSLTWREVGERERLWVTNPGHPIARGIDRFIELEHEEMYGEPFGIPAPEEEVFLSWFEGGEVFRSGVCFRRGAGKIFYFRPGHETYPTYHNAQIQLVLRNAAHWAAPEGERWVDTCPMITAELTPEVIGKPRKP